MRNNFISLKEKRRRKNDMTWPTKKLGEVTILNPKKSEVKELSNDTEVSFVPMTAVNENTQVVEGSEARKLASVRKGYTYFKDGDVLFAKITPCMENGKVAIARNLKNGIGFGSTEFHIIRPTEKILAEWIFYIVGNPSFREEAEKHMTGTAGQQRVPVDFLENVEIPLPPIGEQRKIVEKIEKLFSKIDEASHLRVESATASAALLPSALHQIFNAKGKTQKLSEIAEITSGGTPSRDNPNFYKGNIAWLKSGELNDNQNIEDSEEHITEDALENSNAKVFFTGTLLLAMYGATAGKLGILSKPAATNQAVAGVRMNERKAITKFLFYFLLHYREELIAQAWGGAQPNISQRIIKEINIPLPPIVEQKKIVAYLDGLFAKARELQNLQTQTAADFSALRQSVLAKAFRGELVPAEAGLVQSGTGR